MSRILFFILGIYFTTFTGPLTGQAIDTDVMKLSMYADRISQDRIREHLEILSADEMEGREAGHPGNIKAAEYLAAQLESFGYVSPPRTTDYFQFFPLYKQSWKDISVSIDGKEFDYLTDFYALPSQNPNLPAFECEEILYLGYGMSSKDYNDFQEADLVNRVVVIKEGSPGQGASATSGLEPQKLQAAREAGVRLIFVISEHYSQRLSRYRQHLSAPSISTDIPESKRTNVVYISPRMAQQIMSGAKDRINAYDEHYAGAEQMIQPVELDQNTEIAMHKLTEYVYIPNVVGYLPGKDPLLRHEVLVLSAHLDHVGMRGDVIYNGADDDGSGTSTILEIAKVISDLSREEEDLPRRSLLIFFANAEEKGLLGSAYYADNPLFPLSSTITNLNVDMIGRRDAAHADNPYYVYIIGSDRLSTDLHDINEGVNQSLTNLDLDYTYNDEADPNRFYYRSDHYNFAKHNIPVIFYFTGVHEDYHKPTDTIEKIEFSKMRTIGQLIFGTAWELLNQDERPKLD